MITAKKGHKFKANTQTHSKYVNGVPTLDIEPNSSKKKHSRISPPFWQHEKLFGPKKKFLSGYLGKLKNIIKDFINKKRNSIPELCYHKMST